MTRHLHLVRHAEAEAGAADPGLSARGRRQAHALARRVAGLPVTQIHAGPKRRARETAEVLGGALTAATVQHSHHLEDRTPVPGEDWSSVPPRYRDWLAGVPADERDVDGAAISAGIDHFSSGRGDLLLVTHAFVVASYVRHALDAPAWRWMGLNPANAGLTTLALTPDGPVLVCFNDTGHLDGLR